MGGFRLSISRNKARSFTGSCTWVESTRWKRITWVRVLSVITTGTEALFITVSETKLAIKPSMALRNSLTRRLSLQ